MPDVYIAPDKDKKSLSKSGKSDKKLARGKDLSGKKIETKTLKKKIKPKDYRKYSEVMKLEKVTKNPLATFSVRPKGIRFETQEKEEQVLLLLRRHLLTNVGWVVIFFLMLIAPLALSFFPVLSFLPDKFVFITIVVWYLLTIGYLVEQFLSWYFNVYIITDERIIDIDFFSLIYKEVSAAKIDRIEDVTFRMGGALRNIFNFGTIYVQTAGEKREFDFEEVPRPQIVTKFINEMLLEEEREKHEGRVR